MFSLFFSEDNHADAHSLAKVFPPCLLFTPFVTFKALYLQHEFVAAGSIIIEWSLNPSLGGKKSIFIVDCRMSSLMSYSVAVCCGISPKEVRADMHEKECRA
jgi:hypothetical protein